MLYELTVAHHHAREQTPDQICIYNFVFVFINRSVHAHHRLGSYKVSNGTPSDAAVSIQNKLAAMIHNRKDYMFNIKIS